MKNIGKKFLVVIVALLLCSQTTVLATNDDAPSAIPVTPNKPPKPNPNPTPRPRSRARFDVETPSCYYYEGEVMIEADGSIESIEATITRLDDNMQWSDSGVGNTLVISVSEEPGTYLLNLTLSDGRSYYGEYSLY